MSEAGVPRWKRDFPVRQSEEQAVSRRQFIKIAGCTAAAVGLAGLAKERLDVPSPGADAMRVCRAAELPVGGYRLFRYPTTNDPCILVRRGEVEFAAFSQRCTHLMCPVHYQHERDRFCCPCHEGFFSADDGRVLAGPPPRPLPRLPVEVRHGEVWITPTEA